ncbi:MAG: DUF3472 domain-containing protein [Gemmataceae bacterium]
MRNTFLMGLVLASTLATGRADEKLAGIAARSVHLGYVAPTKSRATLFTNEVTVKQSVPGTYFNVCGFQKGYFGLQELADGKKLLIVSVWDDATGDDPKNVPDEKRTKVLAKDEAVFVKRFGNEGTGGQSFYNFDWQLDTPYRFAVSALADGPTRVAFSGHFYDPATKAWKHLITFSTPVKDSTKDARITGIYAFVEDFRRDRQSLKSERSAEFKNPYLYVPVAGWQAIEKARFTADKNPAMTIDAGPVERGFFLSTGGETVNRVTKLNATMTLAKPGPAPTDFPKALTPDR